MSSRPYCVRDASSWPSTASQRCSLVRQGTGGEICIDSNRLGSPALPPLERSKTCGSDSFDPYFILLSYYLPRLSSTATFSSPRKIPALSRFLIRLSTPTHSTLVHDSAHPQLRHCSRYSGASSCIFPYRARYYVLDSRLFASEKRFVHAQANGDAMHPRWVGRVNTETSSIKRRAGRGWCRKPTGGRGWRLSMLLTRAHNNEKQ